MKRIIKRFVKYCSVFKASSISFIRVLFFSKYKVQIKCLKDSGSCYILGNGPSLKAFLLKNVDTLKSQRMFVVNDFAKSEYYEILRPSYYVLADPSYWSKEVYTEVYEACLLVLNAINDKTSWPISLIIPNSAYRTKIMQGVFSKNRYIRIVDFNDTSVNGLQSLSYFFYKNNLGIPPMKNVLIACIFLSINMGFSEVNILGSDHSWTKNLVVNDKNEVCLSDTHFYDQSNKEYVPFRHIYGDIYKMHQVLRDFALMFEGYHLLKDYSDYKKTNIYNLCSDSLIDAFERKDFKI